MTAPLKVPDDDIREIINNWNNLKPRERALAVRETASEYDVTIGTIYRRLKEYREYGRRKQKNRADKGKPRKFSIEEIKKYVEIIMGIKAYDPKKPNKKLGNPNKSMSTKRAIEIAEKLGLIPTGTLSVRIVNRYSKQFGMTVKNICSPKPAVKLVSEYPNQVHVIDFSVCEQYYLRDSDGTIDVRPWTYKNKPNESKIKIWTFSLVDHYSTVKFIKHFLSPGESSPILYRGLVEAWSKKEDSQFPFHGAPKIVYADKGSAVMSQKVQNFLKALNVKTITHMPGNPRAKGMVESSFKHYQVDFENELRYNPASSIEELNERAYNWLVNHNWSAKENESVSRFAKWMEIKPEHLLELPPEHILRRVTASSQIRTVDAYCTVHVNGETYGVPEDVIGKKVRVWHNIDGGISVQDIETGEMYPEVEQRVAVFGEFNAHKKSEAERMQDEAINFVHELKKSGAFTREVLMRDNPNLHAFPKSGTPIEVESELAQEKSEEYASIYQAKLAIADELRINLGDLPGWMIEEIERALSETLDRNKVSEIARLVEHYLKEARNAV